MLPTQIKRIRRIAKWSGLCMCVLILAAWGYSLRYFAGMRVTEHWSIGIDTGICGVLAADAGVVPDSGIGQHHWGGFGLQWPSMEDYFGRGCVYCVPLWLLLLVSVIPTTYLFYRDRRH